MSNKNVLDWIALILVIIGAINWGLVGVASFNLVEVIFGAVGWLERLIYILVGLSGIYMIYYAVKK